MSADADHIGSATADLMANITDELHDISLRPVGHGGYSEIYTGVWRSTFGSMKVAIKVIRAAPRPRSTNELPRVLRREIAVWKRLLHPNIHFLCGFYEGFGSVPALVSPWYENGDINDYVRLRTADPNIGLMKLKLFADVVTGLEFLHKHHIVHGDIKGGNVLVSSTGVARLCDFGLSRLLLEHSQSTTSTGGNGTVRWMAPELLLVDGAHHSYESDIWACGCLFIEVWSNVLPYHDKANNHQVLIALSRHEPPARPDDMPNIVWSLVQSCCVSETAGRASPSSLLDIIHVSLTMERVGKMVQLNHLPNVVESKLLAEIATSLREADAHGVADLYELSDIELATAVVHYYLVWAVSRSGLFQNPLFEWCLARINIYHLLVPTEQYVVEPVTLAELRPFARLIAQVSPGLAKRLMTKFAKSTMPFVIVV
ncbi:kinase-like protein [Exidia glandulosa HHB12029]|uniref:Kinase-like protein n=1 Tax=Exidia glandulosa HHB12029 TaxID=1314781 RepID=A0A165K247_EXIGL|nr:kinase-like protein [Exidia glandulosa HHB12029]